MELYKGSVSRVVDSGWCHESEPGLLDEFYGLLNEADRRYRDFTSRNGVPCRLDYPRDDMRLMTCELANNGLYSIKSEIIKSEIKLKADEGEEYTGILCIAVAADEEKIRVSVVDNGPGISPKDEQRLFQNCARGRGGGVRDFGLGTDRRCGDHGKCGLFIVRAIAEEWGGSAGYENRMPDGATFFYELPIERISKPITDALEQHKLAACQQP